MIVEQEIEYKRNYQQLSNALGCSIEVMSHPCGDYNKDTLKILKKIGIKIGFRSCISISNIKSSLEIPRQAHSNIFKEMSLTR